MYKGECSALYHLYHDSGKKNEATSPQLWLKLSSYEKGLRRIEASERHYLGLELTEGKNALSFQAYKRFSVIIFRSEKIEHIAAHKFLADNCAGAKVDPISFHQNSPLFDFAKKKTYQEGIKDIDHPWHVYENPLEPVVCPLIALSWYIIAHPSIALVK